MSPLDTPLTFRWPLSKAFAAKRGRRGLGSVRRFGYIELQYPEFTLRYPPRITVRGRTVQGGSVPLRKAPLPSSVDPWSSKRPCGPLAFRRATEGSRGAKEGLGESRGGKGTIRCPCPLLSPPPDGGIPPAAGRRQSPSPWARRHPAGEHRLSPAVGWRHPCGQKSSHTSTGICESLWF